MIPSWLDPHAGLTYQEYLSEVERYAGLDPAGFADELTRERVGRGPLNLQRMNRIGRTFEPSASTVAHMRAIHTAQFWLLLSEPWCGDSAQCVPIISRIAACSPLVELRIVLRDRHPEIMDRFLTNGTRSIPKLVAFSASGEEVFQWGPRPSPAMELVARAKAEGVTKQVREERLHLWFARDRGVHTEEELATLVSIQNARRAALRDPSLLTQE